MVKNCNLNWRPPDTHTKTSASPFLVSSEAANPAQMELNADFCLGGARGQQLHTVNRVNVDVENVSNLALILACH